MHCQHTHTHRHIVNRTEWDRDREKERERDTPCFTGGPFRQACECCFSFFLLRIFNFSHCQRDASASSSSRRGSIVTVTVVVVVVTRCRGCRSQKEDEFARLYFGSFAAQLICENSSRTSQSIISIPTHTHTHTYTSYSLSLTHTHTQLLLSGSVALWRARAICCLCWRNLPTAKQRLWQRQRQIYVGFSTRLLRRAALLTHFLNCISILFTYRIYRLLPLNIFVVYSGKFAEGGGERVRSFYRCLRSCNWREREREMESARRMLWESRVRVARLLNFYTLPGCIFVCVCQAAFLVFNKYM